MSDQINSETFFHLVDLAALELDEAQAEYLRRELNNQLKAIHELEAIPLDESIPASLHGVSYTSENSQPPRADVWKPYPNPAGILALSPQNEDGYIIVPDIPHITLE